MKKFLLVLSLAGCLFAAAPVQAAGTGTDSEIADKYYTHIGEEAQLKAIEAVTGTEVSSAQERIRQALAFLAALPPSPEREKLEQILKPA